MTNLITIELCTEDRARIDRLTEALEAMAKNQPRQLFALDLGTTPAEGIEIEPQELETEEPTNTQPEPETTTEVEKEAPVVTVEDIRSKVLALTAAGKKEEVKTIVNTYAPRVGEIPAEKYAEVLEKLTALEG